MSVGSHFGKNIAILAFIGAAIKVAGLNNGLEVAEEPSHSPHSSYTSTIPRLQTVGNLSFVEAASAPVTGISSPEIYDSFTPR